MDRKSFTLFKIYNLKYNKDNKKTFIFNILTIAIGLAVFLTIQIINLVNKSEINNNAYKKIGADIGVIFKDNSILEEEDNFLKKLKDNKEIDYTKSLWLQGLISAGKRNSNCIVRYINPEEYNNYKLPSEKSNYNKLLEENSIIISKKLATSLNIEIGDKIKLQSIEEDKSIFYKVVDILPDDGEEAFDMNIYGYVFLNKDKLESSLNTENIVSKIYIKNLYNNNYTLEKIKNIFKEEKVQLVSEEIDSLSKELAGSSSMYNAMGILSIIISFVGIISSSLLTIIKRQKDICLLKVFGANNIKISILFLGEILYTTLLGIFMGIGLGFIISYILCYFVFENFYNVIMLKGIVKETIKVFLIGISTGVIFGSVPVILTLQFKPIEILRDKSSKNEFKRLPLILGGISIIFIFGLLFSIYLKNIVGLIIIILLTILVLILYILSRILLTVFTLSIFKKKSVKEIALKSLVKDSKKFSLVSLTISISVAIVGLVLLMYNSILPSLEKQVEGSLGFNGIFKIPIEKKEEIDLALKDKTLNNYYISSIVDFSLIKVNGSIVEKMDDYEYNMDSLQENMNYVNNNILIGEGLKEKSKENNIVLDEDFYNKYKINLEDIITLEINNIEKDFKVIGVRKSDKIKTGQAYINYEAIKDSINNNYLRYYIISESIDSFINYMNSKFDDIVILDIEDISQPYADNLNNELLLLKIISVLCIGSSILLVFNILSITYIGKEKEFLILGMYGGDKKSKRKIIITQGIRLGISSAVLSFIISIFGAILLEGTIGISINYDLLTAIEVILLALGCSLISVLIISKRIVNYKKYNVLRSE